MLKFWFISGSVHPNVGMIFHLLTPSYSRWYTKYCWSLQEVSSFYTQKLSEILNVSYGMKLLLFSHTYLIRYVQKQETELNLLFHHYPPENFSIFLVNLRANRKKYKLPSPLQCKNWQRIKLQYVNDSRDYKILQELVLPIHRIFIPNFIRRPSALCKNKFNNLNVI